MDLRKIKTLIDLVTASGISEIELNDGEEKIKITNFKNPQVIAANAPNMDNQITHTIITNNLEQIQNEKKEILNNIVDEADYVRSPMVGTFYESPSPSSPPFVQIGDKVKIGQTLCIIEAMKLLNEIESHKDGVIKEILCKNASGVEFNQPLFIIE